MGDPTAPGAPETPARRAAHAARLGAAVAALEARLDAASGEHLDAAVAGLAEPVRALGAAVREARNG